MTTPLPAARASALDVLDAILSRRVALGAALSADAGLPALPVRDRALAENLVRTSLRRLGQIDAALDAVLDRPGPLAPLRAWNLLRLGACQILFLRIPAHAAVDSTVALAQREAPKLKGLVNAVLRRLAREGEGLVARQDAARLNTPGWLWRRWSENFGPAAARAVAESHLRPPPLDLSCRENPAEWARVLGGRLVAGSVRLEGGGGPVAALAGYAEGAWWVQDAAAAVPARLLGSVEGETVLDLCAAPGGKTAQLAAAGARVIALERDPARLERLHANLARLGLAAELRCGEVQDFAPSRRFARVLLDAPCSATGTIRRHPDLPWRREEAEIAVLAQRQGRLLDAACRLLEPGGLLVYAVCSLEPEEGRAQIEAALRRHRRLERAPLGPSERAGLAGWETAFTPEGDFSSLPSMFAAEGGCDGFFAARLRLKK